MDGLSIDSKHAYAQESRFFSFIHSMIMLKGSCCHSIYSLNITQFFRDKKNGYIMKEQKENVNKATINYILNSADKNVRESCIKKVIIFLRNQMKQPLQQILNNKL